MTALATKPRAARPTIAAPNTIRTADGTDLFYRDWGTGKPVLFLASWMLSSDGWSAQMVALSAAGHRCIAFDRRGHGRSSDPGTGHDFDTLADDVAAVIEALNLTDVTFVTHSMGAGEAARYMTRHGDARITRLVFIGPSTPLVMQTPDNPGGIPLDMIAAMDAPIAVQFAQWMEDNAAPFVGDHGGRPLIEWVKGIALQASLKALMDMRAALVREDFRPDLAAITRPVLIIHGDQDASMPLDLSARPSLRLLANGTLRIYEGAAHALPMTHAARINADILDFLEV